MNGTVARRIRRLAASDKSLFWEARYAVKSTYRNVMKKIQGKEQKVKVEHRSAVRTGIRGRYLSLKKEYHRLKRLGKE
jgi:hypothetical protein